MRQADFIKAWSPSMNTYAVRNAERVSVGPDQFMIQTSHKENHIKGIDFSEIWGGGIYKKCVGGWNTERRTFCKFELRLYPPYNLLGMQLTPSNERLYTTKTVVTTVDAPENKEFIQAWASIQLCTFHRDFLREFTDPSQVLTPFH